MPLMFYIALFNKSIMIQDSRSLRFYINFKHKNATHWHIMSIKLKSVEYTVLID